MILNAQFYSRFSGPNFEIVVHLLFLAVKQQFLQWDCELKFAQNYDQNYEQKSCWSQFEYWSQDHNHKIVKSCSLQENADEQGEAEEGFLQKFEENWVQKSGYKIEH